MILKPHAGGLGDHLLYSTLPRRCYENSEEFKLFYPTGVRNEETIDLVWGKNPYFAGYAPKEEPFDAEEFLKARSLLHWVKNFEWSIQGIERMCGFGGILSRFPEIYYEPKIIDDWKDTVFIDPFSTSQWFPDAQFEAFYRWVLRWRLDLQKSNIYILKSPGSGSLGPSRIFNMIPEWFCKDIYEYCDIIASCKAFLCTESGSSALAAAIHRENSFHRVFALCTTQHFNDRIFLYPSVRYCVTGDLTQDYHPGW